MSFFDLFLGRRAAPVPPVVEKPAAPKPLSDAEILRRLNQLAAAALVSGRMDRAEAQKLAEAARGRFTEEEFARAVRQAAERQMALKRAAEREAPKPDPLAARAAAGYRATRSFSR
ncbi:hypothetical protein V8J36_04205 [Frigidibacter sp. MR17.14]|uniref:hypothetical protein n=1 Tax=Frigidibacter sp. MR17.14 TaxID=3126509 RepID=UPI003012EF44